MTVIGALLPISLLLGGLGLLAFFWSLKSGQFEDLDGDQHRALFMAEPDCNRADVQEIVQIRHEPRCRKDT